MSRFDAVIIGSGLGGLCTAYILAKEGMHVCVLEKNRQIGGSLQIFSRDKTVFDTGVHYIGGLDEGQNLNRYFKYFGLMDSLKLQRLDMDRYDVISFDGDENEYPHAQGYDNFVEQLARYFPKEREGLQLYINKIREICAAFPLYNLEDTKKDFENAWYLNIDAKSFIDSVVSDHTLRSVLAGTNMLYAGIEGKTPLYVHALVVNSYIESSYRCVDGSSQIAKHLSNGIKNMGGELRNYSEACRFHFKGDEIDEVELTNGTRIAAKMFISGIDLTRTVDMVEGNQLRQAFVNRIHSLENSISSFILNVVPKPLTMPPLLHNLYHFEKEEDVWNSYHYEPSEWPKSVSLFGTSSSKSPDYMENYTVMAYMNYEDCARWAESFSTIPKHVAFRGDGYEEFKQEKAEKLLNLLERRMPGLKQNIQSYTCATPLTYRDYIGSRDGTLYGVIKDYKEPLKTFITPRTKIKNLFLTGQNINLHGVLGVTVSAVVTCSEIVGHPYLINKIKSST